MEIAMGFLTDIPLNVVHMYDRDFKINPAFDTVLAIKELVQEEELEDIDKVNQALAMLIVKGNRYLQKLTPSEKGKLLSKIYKSCINIKKRKSKPNAANVLDFNEDGEYIYASFMGDYGIDLVDAQGKLSWKKFIALFQGLSDKSKIREIMRIRQMKIPKYDGKNSEQIKEIQELKSFYALPIKGGGGAAGLDLLFNTLESMAVKEGDAHG